MLTTMSLPKKVTLEHIQDAKKAGRRISVLTCYDFATAAAMQAAGVEMLLVGDSAAEVVLGLPGTREMPPEVLLALTAAVRRGAPRCCLMADLPWHWRTGSPDETIRWSRRMIDEAGADCIKIEVTAPDEPIVRALAAAGVPTVAHLGLLPQMIEPGEPYRARGRDADSARALIEDARRFEEAGAVMLLLEAVASEVAREITRSVAIPVIGCVAGPHCDGTVVVMHDMLGLGGGHPPRAIRRYENLAEVIRNACAAYVADIHAQRFPEEENSIHMRAGEFEKLTAATGRS